MDTEPIRQNAVREGRDPIGDQVGWHDETDGLDRGSEGVRQDGYDRRHHVGLKEDDEGRRGEHPQEALAPPTVDRAQRHSLHSHKIILCHVTPPAMLCEQSDARHSGSHQKRAAAFPIAS